MRGRGREDVGPDRCGRKDVETSDAGANSPASLSEESRRVLEREFSHRIDLLSYRVGQTRRESWDGGGGDTPGRHETRHADGVTNVGGDGGLGLAA